MKFKLGKIFELRLGPESDISRPSPWLIEALGAFPTTTGISVTEESSLQFSAVYACTNVIADQLASFPKGIFRRIDDRTRENASEHPLQYLIDTEPNLFYSAFDFWHAISAAVLLWGNGFARIIRKKFIITGFEFVHPSKILINHGTVDGSAILFYEHKETRERIPYYNMLHFKGITFDGVQGQGVIRAFAKESIGLSVAAERFGAKFFGNDTLMTKYLSHPASLGDEAMKHLKQSWQAANAGLDNAFTMKILEEGMKLENVGIPPEQAQFLGTRQHQVEEICRWFKVQPHLIQHLLRSTNNNIEHQGIEFVTQTLTPWVVRFEHELNRKIFTEDEKKTYYLKFNMDSLLRGDIKTQTEYFRAGIQWGWLSANEVREKKDMNPREGGDEYLKPLNMIGSNEERPDQTNQDQNNEQANEDKDTNKEKQWIRK